MRTNIVVDDRLMKQALQLSGLPTKKAVVEEGLRLLVQLQKQRKLAKWSGKLQWEGDLDAMRKAE